MYVIFFPLPTTKQYKHPLVAHMLQGKRVCLFGPNANDTLNQMGEYAPKPAKIVTPYAAFASLLPASTVILADGCNTTACVDFDPTVVQVAATCDLNVVVLGLTAYARSQYKNESAACGCDKGDAVEGEVRTGHGVLAPCSVVSVFQYLSWPRNF